MPGAIQYTTDGVTPVDFPDTATAGWGFDFNSGADRVRVVTSTGLNFRINQDTGAPVDGNLGGAAGSVTGTNPDGNISGAATALSGVACTNGAPVTLPGTTTEYGLNVATDGGNNGLYRINLVDDGERGVAEAGPQLCIFDGNLGGP